MCCYILNKETKQVLRSGYTDFEADGTLDEAIEECVMTGAPCPFDLKTDVFYWNGSEFTEVAP